MVAILSWPQCINGMHWECCVMLNLYIDIQVWPMDVLFTFSTPELFMLTYVLRKKQVMQAYFFQYNILQANSHKPAELPHVDSRFISIFYIDAVQTIEINQRGRLECVYTAYSVAWLLMPWWCKEPRHQQPWYWPSYFWVFWFQQQNGKHWKILSMRPTSTYVHFIDVMIQKLRMYLPQTILVICSRVRTL